MVNGFGTQGQRLLALCFFILKKESQGAKPNNKQAAQRTEKEFPLHRCNYIDRRVNDRSVNNVRLMDEDGPVKHPSGREQL